MTVMQTDAGSSVRRPLLLWWTLVVRRGTLQAGGPCRQLPARWISCPRFCRSTGSPSGWPRPSVETTCLLVQDCHHDNFAFLTNMYDDAIGLATSKGVLLYCLRAERVTEADLAFHVRAEGVAPTEPALAPQVHDLMALYQTSNVMLDQNRILPWKEYGHHW